MDYIHKYKLIKFILGILLIQAPLAAATDDSNLSKMREHFFNERYLYKDNTPIKILEKARLYEINKQKLYKDLDKRLKSLGVNRTRRQVGMQIGAYARANAELIKTQEKLLKEIKPWEKEYFSK